MTPASRVRSILAACANEGVRVHTGRVPPLTVESGLAMLAALDSEECRCPACGYRMGHADECPLREARA